ncbi:glutamyl-tRNA reductase [Ereboglobus sp. PH5-5]|uniref:glutamyl-tRNA reductase n=1 Tax=Ereboglobus sp. PH5-5 TaxID=2940529 RepID=UPI0024072132|nr:glutamyl-tRNA reductase [Ereboglobus sp. PH5-5]MDF9834062.1 glutamyl-tRNA reductase [Ereboglobus sp. PH5-5]
MSRDNTAVPEAAAKSARAPNASPGFFFVGANHHATPIELREKLALTENKLPGLQCRLAAIDGLREVVVLNTCNRVEIYGVAETPAAIARIEENFCALQEFPEKTFREIRQHATGRDAIQHLLEVAAGIDSQMLGETEILGQVKDAYADALTRRATGPALNRIFQKTFQYAKHVRTSTAITAGQVSIANVAVDLAQKIFGELGRTRILLLGAGDISEKTARAFQSRGASALTVASRTFERTMALASDLGATALPFEHVPAHLADYDIVVCSTAAPEAVIRRDAAEAAMRRRRAQPLFFIDLAMPRDVEPSVADIENVFVYNLDDLARIAEKNRAARENEVVRAREILREKSAMLWSQIAPEAPSPGPSRSGDAS